MSTTRSLSITRSKARSGCCTMRCSRISTPSSAAREGSAQRVWPLVLARRMVMDFSWSRDEEDFRQEIRDFLKAELPRGWNDTLVLDKESDGYIALAKGFTQTVGAKGWLAA